MLQKCTEMDGFHNISYFSVALNAEIRVIHIEKKYNLNYPDFFSLIYIFWVATASKKHKLK